MAISSALTTITSGIAALSISGVKIKDYDEIASSWLSEANVLYPNPQPPGFLTNFRLDYRSFPHGATAQVDLSYTLNYRFLGTQIGQGANILTAYSDMVDKVVLIINAIITNHSQNSGAASLELGGVSFGARSDPSGNGFHGADIMLNITEMQNT